MRRWLLAMLGLLALLVPHQRVFAHRLCFADKTPYCLTDPFSDYWEANGGLPVFGYPLSAAAIERNPDTGRTYLTQWVERNRLEDHPENAATAYRVLLGLLGKERLVQLGRSWQTEPRESGPKADCLWFAETGHNVCNQQPPDCLPVANGENICTQPQGFKRYWESNGLKVPGLNAYARSLQLFGLPLTEPKMETNSSGDTVLTQWFERGRFEWHPQNPDQFKVLLGLLGTEVRPPTPAAPPAPAPPMATICPALPPSNDATITITPSCGALGSPFTVRLENRQPRQVLHAYMSQPDGTAIPFPAIAGLREPDASGIYTLTGALSGAAVPGIYTIIIEDNDRLHKWISYLSLYRPATPPSSDYGIIPASINGKAEPNSGPIGETFYLYLDGFNPMENVHTWRTAPDGSIFFDGATQLGIDGHPIREGFLAPAVGYVDTNWEYYRYLQVGIYSITYESRARDRKAIIYIRVTPP